LMPWAVRKRFVQAVNRRLSGRRLADAPNLSQRLAEIKSLTRELKAKTGQWPSLFVLSSHPDTEGELEWVRFEVMRQGLALADAYVEERWLTTEDRRQKTETAAGVAVLRPPSSVLSYAPHPKCFVAIDPFALDTVPAPVAGFYAGWMHRIYIAWDR